MSCANPEAHDAHMAISGECPWCGVIDPEVVICEEHGNPNCGICI